jgi:hypothetical protein
MIELYQRLEEYQDSLGPFVNTELIIRTNVDVSLPTVTALEEEIRRCENEYVSFTLCVLRNRLFVYMY